MTTIMGILGTLAIMCAVLVIAGLGAQLGERIELRMTPAPRWADRRTPGLLGRSTLNALRVAQCRDARRAARVHWRHDPYFIPAHIRAAEPALPAMLRRQAI